MEDAPPNASRPLILVPTLLANLLLSLLQKLLKLKSMSETASFIWLCLSRAVRSMMHSRAGQYSPAKTPWNCAALAQSSSRPGHFCQICCVYFFLVH